MGFRIALGAAALEVDREREQAMFAPDGHGSQELFDVAFGIPLLCVRVSPLCDCGWILVVEDALDHTGVHEQAFDLVALEGAALVGGLAVDEELVSADFDSGFVWSCGKKSRGELE